MGWFDWLNNNPDESVKGVVYTPVKDVVVFESISCEKGVLEVCYTLNDEGCKYILPVSCYVFDVRIKWNGDSITIRDTDTSISYLDDSVSCISRVIQKEDIVIPIPEESKIQVEECFYKEGKYGRFLNESQFNKIKQMVLDHPDFEMAKYDFIKNSECMELTVPADDKEDLGQITFKLAHHSDYERFRYTYGNSEEALYLDFSIKDMRVIEDLDVKDIVGSKLDKLLGK